MYTRNATNLQVAEGSFARPNGTVANRINRTQGPDGPDRI